MNVVLAEEFARRGMKVDVVFASEVKDVSGTLPAGVRAFDLGAGRLREFVWPFRNYLVREKPDVVIASMWPLTSLCLFAKLLARSPARMTVVDHNTLSVQYAGRGALHDAMLRTSIHLTYPHAQARVGVSRGVAEDVANLSCLPPEAFEVIYNPIPRGGPAPVSEDPVVEAAWQGWSGFRILGVGRLKAQKNHAMLIRAFKRLLRTVDARLLILGEGELWEQTQAIVRAEGLTEKVLLPGYFSHPMPFYASADLLALSSDYEGFGNVIVEALACGVPVVSTDCRSGPAEILDNGRFGTLVPVGDEVALAAAMDKALHSDHDRDALRRRAAEFAPSLAVDSYLRLAFPGGFEATLPIPA